MSLPLVCTHLVLGRFDGYVVAATFMFGMSNYCSVSRDLELKRCCRRSRGQGQLRPARACSEDMVSRLWGRAGRILSSVNVIAPHGRSGVILGQDVGVKRGHAQCAGYEV